MKTLIKITAALLAIISLNSCSKPNHYSCDVATTVKSVDTTFHTIIVFYGKPKDLEVFKQDFIQDDADIKSTITCEEY
jgi:hypothetical protein